MSARQRTSAGFSLIELLIVLALVGILSAIIIPSSNPSIRDQLNSAAQVLVADVGYTRNLAVANSSTYRLTFDLTRNQYTLTHAGANTALNTLPPTPFRAPGDPTDQQVVSFAALPHVGAPARLYSAFALGTPVTTVTTLDFGPLGESTRPEETLVWFAAGQGAATRYMSVRVNPMTGLCWIENFRTTAPTSGSVAAGS